MEALRNEAGTIIAWVFRDRCENERCLKELSDGRPIHLTPAHTDPRAADCTLVMWNYHFATLAEAVKALDEAWEQAETATTLAERASAYERNVPVKLALVLKEN